MNKNKKAEKQKDKLAGYFYDTSKLTFTGMVIGGLSPILKGNSETINWWIVICGAFGAIALAFLANRLLK